MVQLSSTIYQTEHCLFIIDSSVNWSSPTAAYNDIYGANGGTFPKLATYFDEITTRFPASYFSICYIANTGASNVPNYIDRIYKATGISSGIGSAGLGSSGVPSTPQSFASVDMCRYNLPGGNVIEPALGVFDHEIGHAWGAQIFYTLGPVNLSNGHWLPNSTVDCQLGSGISTDGYLTVNKIHGDPVNGFHWQRVSNNRSNDFSVFSDQTLYLMGLGKTFPTAYVLNNPVYNANLTMSFDTVDTFDHALAVSTYGVRNPDYQTSPKRFKLGFVYVARDLAEVNSVYQAVELSINDFCNGEVLSATYRGQTPFLVGTHYRGSIDALLADLGGNATPHLMVNNPYTLSVDGAAVIGFSTSDAGDSAPVVSVVPASPLCAVSANSVVIAGLPDGAHFFTLKATDAAGKKTFTHFVVEVQRPASATSVVTQPADQTVTAGHPATMVVSAQSSGSRTYQWYAEAARSSTWRPLTNDANYGGVTTTALTVNSTPAMDGDHFLCVVTDGADAATSEAAVLVVNETAPEIAGQPVDRHATPGSSVYFQAAPGNPATTYGYFQYQWQKRAVGSGSWTDVAAGPNYANTTSDRLILYGVSLEMNGDQFQCIVTNTAGSVTTAAATLTVGNSPAISLEPLPINGYVGQTVSFSVEATGSAPFSYQWYRYGVPVGNAATLVLTNVQNGDAGTYGVTVSNAFGSAFSNNVSLTISSATGPGITSPIADQTASVGATVTFTVLATGAPAPTYQWCKDGLNIAGATGSSFTLPQVTKGDAGTYSVVVTNLAGSVTSNGASLAVGNVGGDFNADGNPDLLLQNLVTGERYLQLMNGTAFGIQVPLTTLSLDWRLAASGDFNADGQSDLIWSNLADGSHYIWLMNGTAYGSAIYVATLDLDWRLAASGDFNADGQSDLVWQNTVTGACYIWLMNGSSYGSAVYVATLSLDWRLAATGDFNGDGQSDLLWQNTATGACYVWLMNGTGYGSAPYLTTRLPAWQAVGTGDFDHDGKCDVVWTNTATGEREVWLMDGITPSQSISMGTISLDLALGWPVTVTRRTQVDFNADGKSDILWQNTATGACYVWLMNGTAYSSHAYLATMPSEWRLAGGGDFNDDGKSDILWQNTATGDCYVWFMNGTEYSSHAFIATQTPDWRASTGDFNGDGRADLLWHNITSDDYYIWLMNGTAYSSHGYLARLTPEWHFAGTGDFNGDGKSDILWRNTANGACYVWLMNGTGYSSYAYLTTITSEWQLAGGGDFNGDGKSDLVWHNTADGTYYVWLMNDLAYSSHGYVTTQASEWRLAN